jgi:hypothetical protein
VVVAVLIELEAVEHDEWRPRSFELGDADRAVHRHDRRAGDLREPLVQERYLLTVSRPFEVQIRDCRLKHAGPLPV